MTTPALRDGIKQAVGEALYEYLGRPPDDRREPVMLFHERISDRIFAFVVDAVGVAEQRHAETLTAWAYERDERGTEVDRLRAALAEREGEQDALRRVWQTVAEALSEWTEEIDAESICDAAIDAGLMERVEYDPEQHPETDADEGDMIYVFTPLGHRLAGLPAGQPDATAGGA